MRGTPRALVALVALVASACAGRPSGAVQGSAPEGAREAKDAGAGDAGGPRVCARDAADAMPCAEDCDRGIAFACGVLAVRVERGEGARRDLSRAVSLYERGCELRDASACVFAARMYASGAGVPPSREKQVELLATACALGDAIACAIPAKALATGGGVSKDERRASELWQRACAGGVSSACDALGDAGGP